MEPPLSAAVACPADRLPEALERELLDFLFARTPIVLAANFVNGTLIAAVFFNLAPTPVVAGWWASLVILSVARLVTWIGYRRCNTPRRRRKHIAIAGSALSGVLWGAAGLLFFSAAGETQRMVLGFILGGMGAGAVTSLTPCLPAYYAYLFPSVLPFCVRLALEGDADHVAMAAACLMYLIALALLGSRANRWLTDSMVHRFDNADLVRSLELRVEERTTELQEVNRQLQQDIVERKRAEAALADYGDRQAAIADFGRVALSGIDLDLLFGQAVVLVRDRLAVAGAAVLEEPFDSRRALPRAAVGLEAASRPRTHRAALADHPQRPLAAFAAEQPVVPDLVDLRRLRDPKRSIEAVIVRHDGPFGVLLAVDVEPRNFSANDVSFLQAIANMLAAAIERKRAEQDIERLALQDPLTGLPNRALFKNHLHQELARIRRAQQILAVLLLDLDHFKDVNDTLGHPVGDRLLAAVAGRLRGCLRETDAPARLGGDEFAVVLSDLRSPEDAAAVARKIVDCLSEPFVVDGHELHIGASVGLTISPRDASDVDGLLRNADLALYRAKTEGRNTHQFYLTDMAEQVEARKALEHDLRQAFERGELFLEYQPQFDLPGNRPTGAEALLRWRHPTRGLLLPDDFISVAEATGLIIPLGRWVLERVAEQMLAWRVSGLLPTFVAVNISLSQCRRGDLVTVVDDIATRLACGLDWLELEVTEHLFLPPGIDDCLVTLRRLSSLGVTISIDDFGAGYSSLGRLRSLPVDKVKIDKSFIAELGKSRQAEMIVRAIISLARSVKMTVTAEGVETDQQLKFLIAEGCDCAQGYYLSRPLPQNEFTAMLRNYARGVELLRLGRTA